SAIDVERSRAEHVVTAKFTPYDIAGRLDEAAEQLSHSADADLRLLAGLAREQVAQQRATRDGLSMAKGARPPPAAWPDTPVESAPSEKPLTLTLHLAKPAAVAAVRLHYKPMDPAAGTQVLELEAKAEVSFTIPASEITGNWDLLYFFEVLSADKKGWFEPDP